MSKIKIGVCGGADRVRAAYENGFDYLETGFRDYAENEEYFRVLYDELEKYDIPLETANCFIPGSIVVTGPDIDYERIRQFCASGFERSAKLGVKLVVFGSGGSRGIPEGYTYAGAVRDIIRVTKHYVAPAAAKYGITVAFEPLARNESQTINTLAEGCAIAAATDEPNVACIADLYHMYCVDDTCDMIRKFGGIIVHGHLANPTVNAAGDKRTYPTSVDEFDYLDFFRALCDAGVERVSLEAGTKDFQKDVVTAAKVMRQLADMC